MSENPIEAHFVLQAIVIVTVSLAMLYTGQAVGPYFSSLDVPYAEQLGFAVGAMFIFVPFAILYNSYGVNARDTP